MSLAWVASPKLLIRYTLLGMFNSVIPPITVWLGAVLVNKIAEARLHPLDFNDMLPIVGGLWVCFIIQRTIGSYIGYGRNLYVRRVELEAERRLLAKASRVDLGHFDNSDWHDRLARAKRDVSWRPGDLTWFVRKYCNDHLNGRTIGKSSLVAGCACIGHILIVVVDRKPRHHASL
jgi:ABC-type multidrug transport system fused ATPase/permease subunit